MRTIKERFNAIKELKEVRPFVTTTHFHSKDQKQRRIDAKIDVIKNEMNDNEAYEKYGDENYVYRGCCHAISYLEGNIELKDIIPPLKKGGVK